MGEGGCSDIVKAKNAEDFGFRAIFVPVGDREFKRFQDGENMYNDIKQEEKVIL